MTPIASLVYFYAKKIRIDGKTIKPLMFVVGKLNCSHCVPFWVTIGMNYNQPNLLLTVFINIMIVKLAIKYTG